MLLYDNDQQAHCLKWLRRESTKDRVSKLAPVINGRANSLRGRGHGHSTLASMGQNHHTGVAKPLDCDLSVDQCTSEIVLYAGYVDWGKNEPQVTCLWEYSRLDIYTTPASTEADKPVQMTQP